MRDAHDPHGVGARVGLCLRVEEVPHPADSLVARGGEDGGGDAGGLALRGRRLRGLLLLRWGLLRLLRLLLLLVSWFRRRWLWIGRCSGNEI